MNVLIWYEEKKSLVSARHFYVNICYTLYMTCNTSRFGYIGHPTLRVWGVLQSLYTFLHDITSRRSISIASAQTLSRAVMCRAFFLCTSLDPLVLRLLCMLLIVLHCCLAEQERPSTDYMEKIQKDVTPSMRAILIDWMVEVSFSAPPNKFT